MLFYEFLLVSSRISLSVIPVYNDCNFCVIKQCVLICSIDEI